MEVKTNTLRGNVASTFGADGRDGLTPYIKNNTWWIGDTNTGVSANGIQGIQGIQGEKGDKGDTGYTPQRGVDYWTEADKSEIKGYVDEQFAPWLETLADIKEELETINEGGLE